MGTNVYKNNPGYTTKMAAMRIYGKNPSKIFFSGTSGPISTKLDMKHLWLKYYNVFFLNHDPGMTLTYFIARSFLETLAFTWEKMKTMDFMKTIAA